MAPLWTRKGIDRTRICKNPEQASYVAVCAPHRLFTGCLRSLNRYLIMHALKLYGPHTERQNSYGTIQCPYGPRWVDVWFFNSPEIARIGPGSVMTLGHQLKLTTCWHDHFGKLLWNLYWTMKHLSRKCILIFFFFAKWRPFCSGAHVNVYYNHAVLEIFEE